MAFSEILYRGSLAVHFRCSLSTMQAEKVSAVTFCKQFLAYTVHIDNLIGAIILSINIQVGLNMHLYDDIGDTLSVHRPFEGRRLVDIWQHYASL